MEKQRTAVETDHQPTGNEKAIASIIVGIIMFFGSLVHTFLKSLFRLISALA